MFWKLLETQKFREFTPGGKTCQDNHRKMSIQCACTRQESFSAPPKWTKTNKIKPEKSNSSKYAKQEMIFWKILETQKFHEFTPGGITCQDNHRKMSIQCACTRQESFSAPPKWTKTNKIKPEKSNSSKYAKQEMIFWKILETQKFHNSPPGGRNMSIPFIWWHIWRAANGQIVCSKWSDWEWPNCPWSE